MPVGDPDLPMASHAAIDASERRCDTGTVFGIKRCICTLNQILAFFIKRHCWPLLCERAGLDRKANPESSLVVTSHCPAAGSRW